MFGSYAESAKVLEKLIETYEALPMSEDERQTAINALRAGRAMVLQEEETALMEEEHRCAGFDAMQADRDNYGLTYEQLSRGV